MFILVLLLVERLAAVRLDELEGRPPGGVPIFFPRRGPTAGPRKLSSSPKKTAVELQDADRRQGTASERFRVGIRSADLRRAEGPPSASAGKPAPLEKPRSLGSPPIAFRILAESPLRGNRSRARALVWRGTEDSPARATFHSATGPRFPCRANGAGAIDLPVSPSAPPCRFARLLDLLDERPRTYQCSSPLPPSRRRRAADCR
jgi:hypothetical protein